jgi:opacity protein-like surface antigen
MKRTISALVLAALAAPAYAQRADEEPRAPSWTDPLYLGLGVGQAQWRPGCPAGVASCDDTNTSLGVFAGYQINRIFAAEAGYTNLGKVTFGGASIKGDAWEASGLAMLPAGHPFPERLHLYARLGVYRANLKGNAGTGKETNSELTYGGGAQYEITPKIVARAEWQRYRSAGGDNLPRSDIDVLRLGALWRFR